MPVNQAANNADGETGGTLDLFNGVSALAVGTIALVTTLTTGALQIVDVAALPEALGASVQKWSIIGCVILTLTLVTAGFLPYQKSRKRTIALAAICMAISLAATLTGNRLAASHVVTPVAAHPDEAPCAGSFVMPFQSHLSQSSRGDIGVIREAFLDPRAPINENRLIELHLCARPFSQRLHANLLADGSIAWSTLFLTFVLANVGFYSGLALLLFAAAGMRPRRNQSES